MAEDWEQSLISVPQEAYIWHDIAENVVEIYA